MLICLFGLIFRTWQVLASFGANRWLCFRWRIGASSPGLHLCISFCLSCLISLVCVSFSETDNRHPAQFAPFRVGYSAQTKGSLTLQTKELWIILEVKVGFVPDLSSPKIFLLYVNFRIVLAFCFKHCGTPPLKGLLACMRDRFAVLNAATDHYAISVVASKKQNLAMSNFFTLFLCKDTLFFFFPQEYKPKMHLSELHFMPCSCRQVIVFFSFFHQWKWMSYLVHQEGPYSLLTRKCFEKITPQYHIKLAKWALAIETR